MSLDTALNACNKKLDHANKKLEQCDTLLNRVFIERDSETEQKEFYKEDARIEYDKRVKAERNLKRTRRIGIFGSIGGFIAGVLVVLFI